MDQYLKAQDVDPYHVKSLQEWVDTHKVEPLRGTLMLMLADLRDGKNLTVASEDVEGFRNAETAAVARILDNTATLVDVVKRLVHKAREEHAYPEAWLSLTLREWVEAMSNVTRAEIGSLWRVDWRQVAEHVMAD
jgi:hypothetical protein